MEHGYPLQLFTTQKAEIVNLCALGGSSQKRSHSTVPLVHVEFRTFLQPRLNSASSILRTGLPAIPAKEPIPTSRIDTRRLFE
jgi:hypothetical protein